MEISYTKQGDYLIPDLRLENTNQYNIGKYGSLKLKYLKENNKSLYTTLFMKDELNKYLYELDKLVSDKVNELIIKLTEKENVDEKLKQSNQLLRVSKMNNIKNRAEEIVLNEYIYEASI
jgi:hypothetical protein